MTATTLTSTNGQQPTATQLSAPTDVLTVFTGTLQLWRRRYRTRAHMRWMTVDQMLDIGKTWTEVHTEARKPFWRA